MAISSDSTYLAPTDPGPAYVACDAGASLVLAPRVDGIVDLDAAICVSGLARELWDRSTTGASPTELAAWVASEYGLEPSRAQEDVRSFLADLTGRGLGSAAWNLRRQSEETGLDDVSAPIAPRGTSLSPEVAVELAVH